MNGVANSIPRQGQPAVLVLRLDRNHSPAAISAQPAPLAALLPQVLAQYGLNPEPPLQLAVTGPPAEKINLLA